MMQLPLQPKIQLPPILARKQLVIISGFLTDQYDATLTILCGEV
jgi:hypothetical protein